MFICLTVHLCMYFCAQTHMHTWTNRWPAHDHGLPGRSQISGRWWPVPLHCSDFEGGAAECRWAGHAASLEMMASVGDIQLTLACLVSQCFAHHVEMHQQLHGFDKHIKWNQMVWKNLKRRTQGAKDLLWHLHCSPEINKPLWFSTQRLRCLVCNLSQRISIFISWICVKMGFPEIHRLINSQVVSKNFIFRTHSKI